MREVLLPGSHEFNPVPTYAESQNSGNPVKKRLSNELEIEESARSFYTEFGILTQTSLTKHKNSSLKHAIQKYYPGGLVALKEKLQIVNAPRLFRDLPIPEKGFPRDKRGRIIAVMFYDRPDEMKKRIEDEANKLKDEGLSLTNSELKERNLTGFNVLIGKYYPGGKIGLRKTLEMKILQRSAGHWTPEKIEEEAKKMVLNGSDLSQDQLSKAGMSSLSAAIQNHYPGRVFALREKLGLANKHKPRGYWTPEVIEREIGKILFMEQKITAKSLKELGYRSLANAITMKYPGGFNGLKARFGFQVKKEAGYWKNTENIEREAKEAICELGTLAQSALVKSGRGSLATSINKNYPGGMRSLQEKLQIVPTRKPDGYWTLETIEQEAKDFFKEFGMLSADYLAKADRQDILGAINAYYPGKLRALKTKLGIKMASVKPGYWTGERIIQEAREFFQIHGKISHKLLKEEGLGPLSTAIQRQKGGMDEVRRNLGLEAIRIDRDFWTPNKIKSEALNFIEENGTISQKLLSSKGKADFIGIVYKCYPGGLRKLRVDLGLDKETKLPTYWNQEKILDEAARFAGEFGGLSQPLLVKNKRLDLFGAISKKYPGGISQLLVDLGLGVNQRPAGYYNPDLLLKEAKNILEEHGDVSYKICKEFKLQGFAGAVNNHYPGKMRQLRKDLGLKERAKPANYWTEDKVEKEIFEFYVNCGYRLTVKLMSETRRNDLITAVRKYPGGMKALKEKLGIEFRGFNQEITVPVDQANEQLGKLVEIK